MKPILAIALIGTAVTVVADLCNRDNCLRALVGKSATATSFCATYTTKTNAATTGLPTYARACSNLPSRISSACTCLTTTSSTSSSPTCSPSTVLRANYMNRNGGFDDVAIPEVGQTVTSMPPWYADRLSNTVIDSKREGPGVYWGEGAAEWKIKAQGVNSHVGYGYLNNPSITYCSNVVYSISLAARQNNTLDQSCRLTVFTPYEGSVQTFENTFTSDFQLFGPFTWKPFRDSGPQNADGTWPDVLSLIVQCQGIVGRTPTDTGFEVDSVIIVPA